MIGAARLAGRSFVMAAAEATALMRHRDEWMGEGHELGQ